MVVLFFLLYHIFENVHHKRKKKLKMKAEQRKITILKGAVFCWLISFIIILLSRTQLSIKDTYFEKLSSFLQLHFLNLTVMDTSWKGKLSLGSVLTEIFEDTKTLAWEDMKVYGNPKSPRMTKQKMWFRQSYLHKQKVVVYCCSWNFLWDMI